MAGAEFAANSLAGLVANRADKVLVAGAGALWRWTRGSDEEQALRRCFEAAFKHMLANLAANEDERQQIGEAFRHALTNDAAVEALMKTALAPDPSPEALRVPFQDAGLDRNTLGVDADAALSLLVEGLEAALRKEAVSPGSPLFNRVQLGDLYALRLTLARIAGLIIDAAEWWRKQVPRAAPRSIRLDNFFADYLGLPGRPVPFGGRTADVAALNRWLGDPAGRDRMLLTAPAGRGKSALLAQWAHQIPADEHAVVMVPISLRYGTAEQQAFYAAFAERLGDLYDDPLPVDKVSDAAYCEGYAHRLLEQPLPNGRNLLVVIDGLDEATDWKPEKVLFPAHARIGLRWVVSARELGADDGPKGWLRRLGWDRHPPLVETITLNGLDEAGVAEAAASLGAPLAALAARPEIVKRLHELTEGDPLLVRSYVEDIWKEIDGGTHIGVDDLDRLKPGYLGYFEHWWDDQRRQWPGKRPERDVKVALALLAQALGPLRASELGALAEDYLEAGGFDAAETLRLIRRFVTGDARETGYSFQHPKFAKFFRESEALDPRLIERAAAAYRDWGNATLGGFEDGTFPPAKVPVYLLRHLLAHLLAAEAPVEDLMALTQLPWLRARQALDGSDDGIAYDLTRIREALVRRRAAGGPPCFDERYRIALFLSSIRSVSSNVPAALLRAALDAKLITPLQALHLARSDSNNENKAEKLTVVVPHLLEDEHPGLLGEALAAARRVKDDKARAEAVRRLAPHLSPKQQGKASAAARAIGGEEAQVQASTGRAPYLSAGQLDKALAAAQAIVDEWEQAKALGGLALHLSPEQGDEALGAARAIRNEWARAEALAGLAPHLSPKQQSEALAAARAINDEMARARALTGLAPHLSEDEEERPQVLGEALVAAHAINNQMARARALTELARHLPEDERPRVLRQALTAAQAVGDDGWRAEALVRLAPHLSPEQRREALAAAQAITDQSSRRVCTVTEELPHLSPEQQEAAVTELLATAESSYRGFVLVSTEMLIAMELVSPSAIAAAIIDAQDLWP